jgi:hypothetical protein
LPRRWGRTPDGFGLIASAGRNLQDVRAGQVLGVGVAIYDRDQAEAVRLLGDVGVPAGDRVVKCLDELGRVRRLAQCRLVLGHPDLPGHLAVEPGRDRRAPVVWAGAEVAAEPVGVPDFGSLRGLAGRQG